MPLDNAVNSGAQMGMAPKTPQVNGGYPGASDIPEVQNAGMPPQGMEQASHPIISALQTIQTAVASMEKQGDPKADAIKSGLMQILQALSGQGAEQPEGKMNPFEAPPSPEGEGKPMGMGEDINSNQQAVQLA